VQERVITQGQKVSAEKDRRAGGREGSGKKADIVEKASGEAGGDLSYAIFSRSNHIKAGF